MLVIRGSGTPEQLKEDSIQLKACLEKALHMRVCIYMGSPALVQKLGESKKILEQMEQEAVPGDSGMLYEEEWDKREIAYVSPPWEI